MPHSPPFIHIDKKEPPYYPLSNMFFRPLRRVSPAAIAIPSVFAVFLLLSQFMIVRVEEESMSPTLADGQWVIVLRGETKVRPGDIAVFESPLDQDLAIKRCVLEGPTQPVVDHGWLVTPWGRWYLTGPQWDGLEDQGIVPDGRVFMVGDNQFKSMDSRSYGSIPKEDIVGRVLTRTAWRDRG